jgi:hypothetical protein
MASLRRRVGIPNGTVYCGNEGIRHGRHYATKRQDANQQLGQGIEPKGLGHQEAGACETRVGPERQQPHDAVCERPARVE